MRSRRPGREGGSAAVEFALVLPLFLLLLSLILEYGWYFTNWLALTNGVSEGARAGIKAREWEGEDPVALARQAFQEAFRFNVTPTVNITIEDDSPRKIRVDVSFRYEPLVGYLPDALTPRRVAARAVMAFP
ncbi:MAG: pilus assembly protein [Deltaproteobacteria bacterium]|nr:pilus assembly protein [Deltaproteobacteria bacterium]MBW1934841.1 pilus assembly protein [Deltaproteobacteria bacterium]MBW2102169.1 pilus assembly protein [Deltaproteobacteria bacterium]RLB38534.1 MAG: hypothetical protein DRH20_05515 [Deltaproteobacteria bacterium]